MPPYLSVSYYDSSDAIAAGYGLDDREIRAISGRAGDVPFLQSVQTGSEVHPASYLMGTGDPPLGVKLSDREA
jgi:hypothetical protein